MILMDFNSMSLQFNPCKLDIAPQLQDRVMGAVQELVEREDTDVEDGKGEH